MVLTAAGETLRQELEAVVVAGRATPISIGPDCAAAALLEHLGLRKASYPLDWLAASQAMIEHCLADDFATLLDVRHHQPAAKRRSDHLYYQAKFGLERIFNHHRMPDQAPHFLRAVERFRSAPSPIFVYLEINRWPDAARLDRMQASLRGPLLAYVLMAPDLVPSGKPPSGVAAFRLEKSWDLKRLAWEADRNGLSDRVLCDLAGFVRATA